MKIIVNKVNTLLIVLLMFCNYMHVYGSVLTENKTTTSKNKNSNYAPYVNTKENKENKNFVKYKIPEPVVTATGLSDSRNVPLYGFNTENNRGPRLTTPAILNQMKSMHIQMIRYPGGSNSDWWDWKKGWLVNSPDLPENFKKMEDTQHYGLDSLKKIVDETHSQVIFVLNMITKSLPDQISMLQYAQQIGIPVRWIELGNETNVLKGPGMKKFQGPEAYGETSNMWINQIHKIFPDAKLSVVGGNNNGIQYPVLNNWNSRVLNGARNASAVVLHDYPVPDNVIDDSGINFEKLYQQTIAIYNKGGYNKLSSDKEVWVTEYNIQWAYVVKNAANKAQIQTYATGWGEALAALLMNSTLTNISPQVKILLNHGLSGFSIFAAIATFPKETYNLLPNGIGMQAWLKTSAQMNRMQKIQFTENGSVIPDYSFFGWQFSAGNTHKFILVNMEPQGRSVNLQRYVSSSMNYQTLYADKNQQVWKSPNGTLNGLHEANGSTNGMLQLPPYSITTIE